MITHIYEKGGEGIGEKGEDRQSQEIEEPEWDNERDKRDDNDGGGMTMKKTSGTNMS